MKKLKLVLSMIWLLALGLIAFQANGQLRKMEVPPTFSVKEAQALPAQAYVKMPVNFSVTEWLAADKFNAQNGIPKARYARDIAADITMDNSGVWVELPDGRKVWRVAIEAKNAKALVLRFSDLYLPKGSKLFLYNFEKTNLHNYFDNASNPKGGTYMTDLVAGDIAVLEYLAPEIETGDKVSIKIAGVGYGYNHIKIVSHSDFSLQAAGESGNCQVNVICSEGDNWREQIKSTCAIYEYWNSGMYEACSGTLINNARNDGTPYIALAWHCYGIDGTTPEWLLAWRFRFFFESETCVGNTGYNNYVDFNGCYLRAESPISGGGDGALFELRMDNDNVDKLQQLLAEDRISFAGWDRRGDISVAQSGVGISHPSLDIKKIATFTNPATIDGNVNFGSVGITASQSHWEVFFTETENGWAETEGGSSGSGLFNQDGRLIGTLSGGTPVTVAPVCSGGLSKRALYGRLWYNWDQYGSGPANQFKYWLDPDDTGVEYIDAFPPDIYANFIADQTSIFALQSVQFTSILSRIDSVQWEFSGGIPATSTELNPNVQYTTPGQYDVRLTAYGSDTILRVLKRNYITVTIKGGTAYPPVADFGVLKLMGGIDDNATNPPTTVSANEADNPTYIAQSQLSGRGWARVNSDDNIGTGYDGTGDYYYRCFLPSFSSPVAIMYNRVPIDMTTNVSKDVSFQFKSREWVGDVDVVYLVYRTNPNDNWTVIWTRTTATGTTNPPPWVAVSVTLPTAAANATFLQVGFYVISNYSYGVGVDNIKVGDAPYYDAMSHVTVWEGDMVEYVDASTGPAVLYKYDFEGGTPSESTSDAPVIAVKYEVANVTDMASYNPADDYSASQWVKNTAGEDEMVHEGYVTVIGRLVETDIDTITSACGAEINEVITLRTNRNWSLTVPAGATITPASGTVAVEGEAETFSISVYVPANTDYQSLFGLITITTDDEKASKSVYLIQQSGTTPTNLVATRYDSINALITWNRPVGMPEPLPPPGPIEECDILLAGGGDFEDASKWSTWTMFNGSSQTSPVPWGRQAHNTSIGVTARGGAGFCAGSRSWVSSAYQSDSYLVTPKLLVTPERYILEFWEMVSYTDDGPDYMDDYRIMVATTPSPPTTVGQLTQLYPSTGYAKGSASYTKQTVNLSAYIGQEIYIAFHHYFYDGEWMLIDDVSGINVVDCDVTSTTDPCDVLTAANGNFENPSTTVWGWDEWTVDVGPASTSPYIWQPYDIGPFGLPSRGMSAISVSYDAGELTSDCYLVSPLLEVTDDMHTLEWADIVSWPPDADEYNVKVIETSGVTPAIGEWVATSAIVRITGAGTWTERSLDLSAYIGKRIYVAFHHDFYGGDILALDDVRGLIAVECAYPDEVSPCDIIFSGGDATADSVNVNDWVIIDGPANNSPYTWDLWNDGRTSSPSWGSFSVNPTSPTTEYTADSYLITPELAVTAEHNVLTYYIKAPWQNSDGDYYNVFVSTTAGAPAIAHFTTQMLPEYQYPTAYGWQQVTIDMSAYTGQTIRVAFHHNDDSFTGILIDDIGGLIIDDCNITSRMEKPFSSINNFAANNSPAQKVKEGSVAAPKLLDRQGSIDLQSKSKNGEKTPANSAINARRTGNGRADEQKLTANSTTRIQAATSVTAGLIQLQNLQLQAANASTSGLAPITWAGAPGTGIVGASGSGFIAVHKWTADEASAYANAELRAIELQIGSGSVATADLVLSLVVFENDELIHSQPVTDFNINEPTIVALTEPVVISGTKDLYIGYRIEDGYAGYPAGGDAGPAVMNKGNVMQWLDEDTWSNLYTESNGSINYNWWIKGWIKPSAGYNLYRQRLVHGVAVGEPQMIAGGLGDYDTVYNDVNIYPGGEYCYWITYLSKGVESCTDNEEDCVFILYQQEINPISNITEVYGVPPFNLDKAGTDGHVIETTADDFDYFDGRTIPVTIEIVDGTSISLAGVPSDYTVSLTNTGVGLTNLRAIQEGISDTLLAADTVYFSIETLKKDLYVTAENKERLKGQDNPAFTLIGNPFAYGEGLTDLDVMPTTSCVATNLSPVGDYAIVVQIGLDKNYIVIPVNGILTVKENGIIPNAFDPHELNGMNDAFMRGHRMQIFNRYGVLLYETKTLDDIDRGWNGRNQQNDRLVDPGVYYYILKDENGKVTHTGSVTVLKK